MLPKSLDDEDCAVVANEIDRLSESSHEMPHLPWPQTCQLDGEPHGRCWHHGRELTAS